MWSGPRNISTALMYAFRQRSDTAVVDEPLYGYYLKRSGAEHPGRERVMAAMDCDGERVVREVLLGEYKRPVLFLKNMAHHLTGLEPGFLEELEHLLLTREPSAMLASLSQQLPEPTLRDTGLREQVELLDYLLERGRSPVVLEAKQVLLDPKKVLHEACDRLGLPFEDAMLSWPSGPKPEDGVWADYWYDNVHASSGFAPYRPSSRPLPERLEPLLAECLPYFERLSAHAIMA